MGSPKPLTKKQIMDMIAKTGDLSDLDMRGVDLSGVCFDGVDLRRAKLAECNLSRSTFRGADLSQASMWHADCKDACFDNAIMEETDMDFCYLEGATFRNARVKKAIFPINRITLAQINSCVKTGRKLSMDRNRAE